MSNNNDNDILDHIIYLSKDLKMLYKRMNQNMTEIEKCKQMVVLKNSDSMDDFKFYCALIDDSLYYHRRSTKIRKSKFSKDLRKLFKVIGIDRFIEEDIFFSSDIISQGIKVYKESLLKSDNNNESNNDYFWMNQISLKKYDNWPNELRNVLFYHKFLIESLIYSSEVDINFFKKKRSDNKSIHEQLTDRIQTGFFGTNTKKNELILEINNLKENLDTKVSTYEKTIKDKDAEIEKLSKLINSKDEEIKKINENMGKLLESKESEESKDEETDGEEGR